MARALVKGGDSVLKHLYSGVNVATLSEAVEVFDDQNLASTQNNFQLE